MRRYVKELAADIDCRCEAEEDPSNRLMSKQPETAVHRIWSTCADDDRPKKN